MANAEFLIRTLQSAILYFQKFMLIWIFNNFQKLKKLKYSDLFTPAKDI